MNNKGFISTSVVYSFFIVFLLLLLYIVDSYTTNRVLLKNVKTSIINNINEENSKLNRMLFSEYIKSIYEKDSESGESGLYYFDNLTTVKNVNGSLTESATKYNNYTYEATDYSYRYVGVSQLLNNYVYFGCDTNCTINNLYRIIGIYTDTDSYVKLVKNTPLTTSKWANSGNTWNSSTVKTYLNTTYLTNLGTKYSSLIATKRWYVGGCTTNYCLNANAQYAYNYELGGGRNTTIYNGKIGLLYLSEYYYATLPEYWTKQGIEYNDYNIKSQNWLAGYSEWTMSPDLSSGGVYAINSNGQLESKTSSTSLSIRPTFYLESSVLIDLDSTYTSSNYEYGSIDNPYRIR
jgi:hypothetical protein